MSTESRQQSLKIYQEFFNIQSQKILTAFNDVKTNCLEDLKDVLPTNNKQSKLHVEISVDYTQQKLKIFTQFGTLLEFSVEDMLETGDTRLHKSTSVYSKQAYEKLNQCFIKLGYKNLLHFQKL